MIKRVSQFSLLAAAFSILAGCASYSISEKDMTRYLQDSININQSVGVESMMYAQVAVEDLQVKIGRADADRVSVFANTNAQVQVFNMPNIGLDLDIEFSAIPEYDKENGEVYLKSLRLESIDENGKQLPENIANLLRPAVSMIGLALSQQPVYKLSATKVQEALLKSADPNLVIKNNALVIELFD